MSKPSHIAYAARSYKDSDGTERTRWHEVGAVFPTKSGNGFNVKLFALPVDGQLSLFVPSEKPADKKDESAAA